MLNPWQIAAAVNAYAGNAVNRTPCILMRMINCRSTSCLGGSSVYSQQRLVQLNLQAAGEQCLPRPAHGWTLKAAVQQMILTPVLWQRTQRHVFVPHNALHGQFAASAAPLLP